MSTTEIPTGTAIQPPAAGTVDYKLEVFVIPVIDVDRAKAFYKNLGWREDADFPIRDDFRVIQMTPPGSPTSVIFGSGVAAPAAPLQSLVLAVYDVEVAREDLVSRGVEVSEIFHGSAFDAHGERPSGLDPDGNSYSSWVSFSDPEDNGWLLQEIKTRLPGR
jgi:catechol 2,3-dioxygenase-like lactoylglutathione lyase family enzyme